MLSDGTQTLELHVLRGNVHAEEFIVGYLPKDKILIVADAFSPRAPVTQTPANINPSTKNLWENIERLKLDVQTVLPIHGAHGEGRRAEARGRRPHALIAA